MNQTPNQHTPTCSCNSCVYKHKKPIAEINRNGSRIDKLYYDKYLPLRERKLIDKLVRTRGVYDDIRNRILSLSSVDITNDHELEETQPATGSEDTNKAVIKLVDIVDRGEYLPLKSTVNLHNDCCKCCKCSSKIPIPKHHKLHMHIPAQEDINQWLESHQGEMQKETRKVGFKAARSDPCMCTLKFSKTPRRNKPDKKSRYKDIANKHVEKKNKREPKAVNTTKCECPFDVPKQSFSEKSTDLLKNAENKLRESIRSSISKIENVFRIKKDSLMIFRDKLKRKQELKEWECDIDYCIPDECVPEDCYEKIKRRENMTKHKAHHHHITDTQKVRNVSFHAPKARGKHNLYTQLLLKQKNGLIVCDCKSKTKSITSIKEVLDGKIFPKPESPVGYELKRCFCTQQLQKPHKVKPEKKPKNVKKNKPTKTTMKKNKAKNICDCEVSDSMSTQTKKESVADEILPVIQNKVHDLLSYECEPSFCVPGECNTLACKEKVKQRDHKNIKSISKDTNTVEVPQKTKITSISDTKPPLRNHRGHRKVPKQKPPAEKSKSSPNALRKQAVRISSSFEFDIEFFKEKNYSDGLENSNIAKKRHSDNSFDEYSEQTKIKSEVKNNKNFKEINNLPESPSDRSEQAVLEPLLKRCLCSLKLHKTPKQKPKFKRPKSKMTMTSKEIKAKNECKCKNEEVECKCEIRKVNPEPDNISAKSEASMTTEAVVNYVLPPPNYPLNLLPYECEPQFCIPGKCDPLVCEKRIKARNLKRPKTFSKEINTDLKKSTRTITSKSVTSFSTRKVQMPKRKKGKAKEVESYRIPQADMSKSAPNAPHRQVVRISSNFRFDIEFYKDITPPNDGVTISKEDSPLSISNDIKKVKKKVKQKSIGENRPQIHENMTQVKKKSSLNIMAPMKRCLCSLKLQKKPKQQTKKSTTKKTMTTDVEYDKIDCECKNAYTQTKKQSPKSIAYVRPPIVQIPGLLPYECEPNFCIPGKCNPLICDERIKMRNKISQETEPLLKRCFCTLKFHNDNNTKRNRTVIPLQNKMEEASVKSIGTETNVEHQRKGKLNKLLLYECEPAVCEPGLCDPYVCEKLIKKRNMPEDIQQTKHANTEKPRKKSVCSETKYFKKAKKNQSSCSKALEDDEVTKTNRHDVPTPVAITGSRQSVRLGSKFNFSIEFYKDKTLHETLENDSRKVKQKPKIGVKFTKEIGTKKTRRGQNGISQTTELLPKVDKSLSVESKLERCFCTLKLHKKGNQHKDFKLGRQQHFMSKNVTEFPTQTPVSPRECTPCLCIATKRKKK